MTAKMKSVWAPGRFPHFWLLAPMPDPHSPPVASAKNPWLAYQPWVP